MSLLDGFQRVLFAHAHPDDETLATGALIAALADRGVNCQVVTATRGEQGEVRPEYAGLAGAYLVRHRIDELGHALRALGVSGHAFLGTPPARQPGLTPRAYTDSGMVWIREGVAGPGPDSDQDAFTGTRAEVAAADLVAGIHALRPDLVISYDPDGGYFHPDHVHMHRVARLAAEECGVPMLEIVSDPDGPGEWLDLAAYAPVVTAALECYGTQLEVQGHEVVHVGGQREPMALRIGLRPVS